MPGSGTTLFYWARRRKGLKPGQTRLYGDRKTDRIITIFGRKDTAFPQ